MSYCRHDTPIKPRKVTEVIRNLLAHGTPIENITKELRWSVRRIKNYLKHYPLKPEQIH